MRGSREVSWYATPVYVVRDAHELTIQKLAFDVILCPIGEEELGSHGRNGGHVYSGNHIDGC